MKKLLIVVMAFLGCGIIGFSQEKSEFEPHGKPTFKIFTNYHSTFTDGDSYSQFELNRAYFGYGYSFSENWSGKLVFDVGNPKAGDHQMAAYVKNAYMTYKSNGWTLNFGLIGTTSFKTQEKAWGYRYIEKSFQDLNKYTSSADLGISAAYKFNDILSADVAVINGEGYKKVEADSIFNVGIGATLKPAEGLELRAYYETTTKEDAVYAHQNTLALFAGYSLDKFSIGAEYASQQNHKKMEGADMSGYAVYGTYKVGSSKLFARFDNENSDNDWNTKVDGTRVILGAEFNPVKGIKIAPNYKNFNPKADGARSINYFYVNCEIKF